MDFNISFKCYFFLEFDCEGISDRWEFVLFMEDPFMVVSLKLGAGIPLEGGSGLCFHLKDG